MSTTQNSFLSRYALTNVEVDFRQRKLEYIAVKITNVRIVYICNSSKTGVALCGSRCRRVLRAGHSQKPQTHAYSTPDSRVRADIRIIRSYGKCYHLVTRLFWGGFFSRFVFTCYIITIRSRRGYARPDISGTWLHGTVECTLLDIRIYFVTRRITAASVLFLHFLAVFCGYVNNVLYKTWNYQCFRFTTKIEVEFFDDKKKPEKISLFFVIYIFFFFFLLKRKTGELEFFDDWQTYFNELFSKNFWYFCYNILVCNFTLY